MTTASVLMIDDDQELCALLSDWLGSEGFQLDCVHDGEQGLARALTGEHEAIILDLMLPGINGLDLLRSLRQEAQVPVLMLSARGEPVDRILGLELGADDYLAKPCDPRELVARLRALLRRSQHQDNPNEVSLLEVGDLRLDPVNLVAWRDDEMLGLTQTEAQILAVLLRQNGQVVDRQTLSREVLGKSLGPYDRSLDMHISNLRRKLGPHAEERPRIQALRGRGYIYAE